MSPTTQPLPASSVASTTPAPSHDLERLLTLWRDLALRAAHAAARNDAQEQTLTGLQLQVEEAIADRHPELSGAMDELLVWETTLAHSNSGPAATCLHCRRARCGFPGTVPLPTSRSGAR